MIHDDADDLDAASVDDDFIEEDHSDNSCKSLPLVTPR
jgi:hypothetical protein